MSRADIAVIKSPPSVLGEGPMWSQRDQALYWIDVVGRKVLRLSSETGEVVIRDFPYAPSAIYPHINGGFLLVTKKGLALFDFDKSELKSIPVPSIDFAVEIFNDGACDKLGRLWLGTRHFERTEPKGSLYCVTPDFSVKRWSTGFVVSNGIAWSPDGGTLYQVETFPGKVYAYDFDLAAGQVSNRRILIDYDHSRAGHPDGCTVDTQGGLWIAEVEGSCVARYTPDGRFDREVRLPISKPTSVMFGGPDLSTLYVTSMRFGLSEERLKGEPLAGALFALDVGAKGIVESPFGGAV